MTGTPCPVSVVIPAYNDAAHLPAAIDAAWDQTRPPREVIVIDDGSSDNTPEVLRAHADRVIHRRQENAGSAVARNLGIELATSEWIAFFDADDLWLPNHLERCFGILSRHSELMWCCGAFTMIVDGRPMPGKHDTRWQGLPTTRGDTVNLFDAWVAAAPIQTSGFVIRKSAIESAGWFVPEMRRGQDRDLWFRIALQHPRMGFVWPPTIQYIRNAGSVTARYADLTDQMLCRLRQRAERLPELDEPLARAFEGLLRFLARELVRHALGVSRPDQVRRLLDEFGWLLTRRERFIARCGSRTPAPVLRWLGAARRYVT